MIQAIRFRSPIKNKYKGFDNSDFLFNISQVNTFVGANNSGKSRLLRDLFSREAIDFHKQITEKEVNHLKNMYTPILTKMKSIQRYGYAYKHKKNLDDLITNFERMDTDSLSNLSNLNALLNLIEPRDFENTKETSFHTEKLKEKLYLISSKSQQLTDAITKIGTPISNINKIYIPILRGLRPICLEGRKFTSKNLYLERTNYDYFEKEVNNGKVFTGLSIYEEIKKLLLGDEIERNEIRIFELFLGQNIFKRKITLIPKYGDDVLHIKIGNKKQFPIYKLGDGLQSLIIILFPIFTNRNQESFIFIEEPETHLHPKWQRLLSRSFKEFQRHTFFLSSHSSALINTPSNSIFVISQKDSKTNIHYSNIKTDKVEILRELGYKPNDLYQTNYILWVEGQSDKIYINYLIKIYAPELIEDEDYSIMFYGGSSFKHLLLDQGDLKLDFIQSLNQNYGIVLDSDRTMPEDEPKQRKKDIEKLFKENNAFCWLTEFREIENYIPIDVFETAVKQTHKLTNIKIDDSNFGDRNTIEDLNAKPTYKPSIKLSQNIFQKIQKNKNGSTKGIDAKSLRKEIENSLKKTKKVTRADKIRVAQAVAKLGFTPNNPEMVEKIELLVKEIRKANE